MFKIITRTPVLYLINEGWGLPRVFEYIQKKKNILYLLYPVYLLIPLTSLVPLYLIEHLFNETLKLLGVSVYNRTIFKVDLYQGEKRKDFITLKTFPYLPLTQRKSFFQRTSLIL